MAKNGKPKSATLVVVDKKGITTKCELVIGETKNHKHFTVEPKDSATIEGYGKLYLKP